jgi:hypothetical protein
MLKVKSFHGCLGRLNRDASKTTGICSGEWTHVRGRMTMGITDKEISKFLATRALKDSSFVRELEVVPKKTMPYRIKPCELVGNSKKHCQKKQPRIKQSKLIEKAKKKVKNNSESKIKKLEKDFQKNVTKLCTSEDSLRKTSKDLGIKMMRSKSLIMVQQKLFDHLLDFEVEHTTGLKNSP